MKTESVSAALWGIVIMLALILFALMETPKCACCYEPDATAIQSGDTINEDVNNKRANQL